MGQVVLYVELIEGGGTEGAHAKTGLGLWSLAKSGTFFSYESEI